MGLFGPAKSSRPTAKLGRTGGAGNNTWYNSEIDAASSQSTRRPSSRGTAAVQYRPASATATAQRYGPASSSSFAATQAVPSVASYPRPASSSQSFALPTAVDHEEHCICTVCACGKHACPPTPRETHYDPNMTTEARQAYQGKFAPAKRAAAPGQWRPHDAPFEGVTTHQADYLNHGRVAPRSGPSNSSMMDTGVGRSNAPFDDTTTHKSDYPAHPLAARSSLAPKNDLSFGDDDRDFSTEGRNAFPAHPVQARGSRPVEGLRPSLPFQGTSTNKSDFPHHIGARPSIPKFRTGGFAAAPEDRDFTTENRGHFTPKRVDPCPAIPVHVLSKPRPGHVYVEHNAATGRYQHK